MDKWLPETAARQERWADRLERFWHEKGFPKVRVWVNANGEIRSNLVNGLPK